MSYDFFYIDHTTYIIGSEIVIICYYLGTIIITQNIIIIAGY